MQLKIFSLVSILVLAICFLNPVLAKETKINDDLLKDLSSDLAKINRLIEEAKEEYKKKPPVKVIQAWSSGKGMKFGEITASDKKVNDVKAFSIIKVPWKDDYLVVNLGKIEDKKESYIAVTEENSKPFAHVFGQKALMVDGQKVFFYSPKIAHDPLSVDAVKQYISWSTKIREWSEKILKALAEIKAKYEASPIKIEGFKLTLPWISVEIEFKFK